MGESHVSSHHRLGSARASPGRLACPAIDQGRKGPPCMHPKLCKLYGPQPPAMHDIIEDSARASKSLIHTPVPRMNGFMRSGWILMKISLAIRGTTTDPLPLFSARMGQQFLDIEAEHLDIKAIQEWTAVGRRAEYRRAEYLQL